jgi:recombination protein RecT
MNAKRMVRILFNCVNKNPKLLECERDSLLMAALKAVELGLEPDTPTQQCHLIPYGKRAQLIIGYRGLLKLARETKGVSFIEAHPVFENEEFELTFGLETVCRHVPILADAETGPVKLYYSIVRFIDSHTPLVEWMSASEVESIRQAGAAANSEAWKKYPIQMGRKVILKRTCNYIPQHDRLSAAIEADNKAEAGEDVTLDTEYSELLGEAITPETNSEKSSTDQLAEEIGATEETPDSDGQPETPIPQDG